MYVWGLKGRFDEHSNPGEADKEHLNEHSRNLYKQECEQLVAQLNKLIPDDQPKLFVPDLKFNRRIGDYAHQSYSITGERLDPEEYKKHCQEVLPNENDMAQLTTIFAEGGWVAEKKATTPGSMTEAGHIQVSRDGPVARIVFNRPPLNILHIPALQELNAAFDALPVPPHLRFLVFTGSEHTFSTGVDVRDHTPDRVAEMLGSFHRVFRKLWSADWITIAAVRGHCLGGGMELATFCDFVVATHTARFGQPEIKLGCFPPVAAVLCRCCWVRAARSI